MRDLRQETLNRLAMNRDIMNRAIVFFITITFLTSCNESKKTKSESKKGQWEFKQTVKLTEEVRPLSIAIEGSEIWLSDPGQNRVLKINRQGELLDSIIDLQRPMNIDLIGGKLYVPEYLSDRILIITESSKDSLSLINQLNAPASIDVSTSQIAIADFYQHRILLKNKDKEVIFGSEGSKQGQFHYPTDVKLYKNKIFVADAYNNRVQVFNDKGVFEAIIGNDAGIKVASGLDVSENTIVVTDQENNRVLIFDLEGNLVQILTEKINYPTDVFLIQDELWVANFKTNELTIYQKK